MNNRTIGIKLGCRVAGIYYCSLNWHFTAAELEYILRDCGARAVIGNADLLRAAVAALPPGVPVLAVGPDPGFIEYDGWLDAQAAYDGPPVSPRGLMGYTSGTTGRPKGVRRHPVPIEELPDYDFLAADRGLIRDLASGKLL